MVLDNLILSTSKLLLPSIRASSGLRKYFQQFRSIEILFRVINNVYGTFLVNLIFIGVILASCSGSMIIRWHGKINTLIYVMMPVITLFCFADAISLTFLVTKPLEKSKRFLKSWGFHLRKREE